MHDLTHEVNGGGSAGHALSRHTSSMSIATVSSISVLVALVPSAIGGGGVAVELEIEEAAALDLNTERTERKRAGGEQKHANVGRLQAAHAREQQRVNPVRGSSDSKQTNSQHVGGRGGNLVAKVETEPTPA